MPLMELSCDPPIWVSLGYSCAPCDDSSVLFASSTRAPTPYCVWGHVPGTSDATANRQASPCSQRADSPMRGIFEEPLPEMLKERSSPDKEEVSGRRKLKAEGGVKCKGPAVGLCLVYSRRDKGVSVAGGEKVG